LISPFSGFHAVAFTPDGLFVVTAGDRTVRVWRKDGRPAGDFPPLPTPDDAWHRVRLVAAIDTGSGTPSTPAGRTY
jgi:hypothetical protein